MKEKIDKVEYVANFCGKIVNGEWDHFLWNININGQFFTYKTGLGHFTPQYKTDRNVYRRLNKKPQNSLSDSNLGGWLHVPSKLDVLNCLFLDSYTIDESFENWCDNLGYNSDSIDALEIYRACVKNYKKLKSALGADFNEIRDYIESLEL